MDWQKSKDNLVKYSLYSDYTRLSLLSIVDEMIHPSLKSSLPYPFVSVKPNTFQNQFRAPKRGFIAGNVLFNVFIKF